MSKVTQFVPLRDTSSLLAIWTKRIKLLVPARLVFLPNRETMTFDLDYSWSKAIMECAVLPQEGIDLTARLQLAAQMIGDTLASADAFNGRPFTPLTMVKLNDWLHDQDMENRLAGRASHHQLILHALGIEPYHELH